MTEQEHKYNCDFTCPKCEKDFEAPWLFGDHVICPYCKTEFETDYETNEDEDIQGPWIVNDTPNEKPDQKPTPGPWGVAFEPGKIITIGCGGYSAKAQKPRCIALIPNGGEGDLEPEREPIRLANARLISQAWMIPGMVEAFQEIYRLCHYHNADMGFCQIEGIIKDILAKLREGEK